MIRDYDTALQHIKGVVDGEPDLIANLSNIAAILKNLDGFFWVGFYLVKGDELVLGPFQGPVACTRISFGKGVCGKAWEENRSQLVPDVHAFEGHIACNPNSKSEVVIPIRIGDKVGMVLDVDSDRINDFSELDLQKLEEVGKIISDL
jgi:GAF domain-containing protein